MARLKKHNVLQYRFFEPLDLYLQVFTDEWIMNNDEDDDKTLIQTDEDRRKLEKRLLEEQSEDVTPIANPEESGSEKSD